MSGGMEGGIVGMARAFIKVTRKFLEGGTKKNNSAVKFLLTTSMLINPTGPMLI
jgi:hypothetical protein